YTLYHPNICTGSLWVAIDISIPAFVGNGSTKDHLPPTIKDPEEFETGNSHRDGSKYIIGASAWGKGIGHKDIRIGFEYFNINGVKRKTIFRCGHPNSIGL